MVDPQFRSQVLASAPKRAVACYHSFERHLQEGERPEQAGQTLLPSKPPHEQHRLAFVGSGSRRKLDPRCESNDAIWRETRAEQLLTDVPTERQHAPNGSQRSYGIDRERKLSPESDRVTRGASVRICVKKARDSQRPSAHHPGSPEYLRTPRAVGVVIKNRHRRW